MPTRELTPEEVAALSSFAIHDQLHAGAFGAVYAGTLDGRPVAIKRLHKAKSAAERDVQQPTALREELAALERFEHPCVVRPLAYCAAPDSCALVFERLAPLDLGHVGSLSERLAVLRDAARGLAHMHERGVVHRDVKPSNLVLIRDSASGRVTGAAVCDLGLALGLEAGYSFKSADAAGTRLFVAPEATEREVRPASDVYSLGVTALCVLAGRDPAPGDATVGPLLAEALGGTLDALPAELRWLVPQMLQRDFTARPPMAVVAMVLERLAPVAPTAAAADGVSDLDAKLAAMEARIMAQNAEMEARLKADLGQLATRGEVSKLATKAEVAAIARNVTTLLARPTAPAAGPVAGAAVAGPAASSAATVSTHVLRTGKALRDIWIGGVSGVIVDVQNRASLPITITSIIVGAQAAASANVSLFWRDGTANGVEGDASKWEKVAEKKITVTKQGVEWGFDNLSLTLVPGKRYAFFVHTSDTAALSVFGSSSGMKQKRWYVPFEFDGVLQVFTSDILKSDTPFSGVNRNEGYVCGFRGKITYER